MTRFPKIFLISIFFTGILLTSNSCVKRKITMKPETIQVYDITQTSALSGGNLSDHMFGTIIEKGICWGYTPDPTLKDNRSTGGSGMGNYVSRLTNLQPGTEYYVRAYFICGPDTLYGNNVIFLTEDYGIITDIDGNVYNTVNIGTQTWMAENLKTTRYNNGKAIPLVEDEEAWANLLTPGYCWYGNDDEVFKPEYGALYNWYAVNTELLCPAGWHVPTEDDWLDLTIFLDGESKAGGKLKQTGLSCWVEPNTGATNECGFNALPGGFRYSDGNFYDFGFSGYWWSSGENSAQKVYFRFLYYNEKNIYRFSNDKTNGFSIRCIKDK